MPSAPASAMEAPPAPDNVASKIVVVAALTVATLVLFLLLDRYAVVERQLLPDPGELSAWRLQPGPGSIGTAGDDGFRLHAPAAGASVSLSRTMTGFPTPSHVRVRAMLRHDEVGAGERPWEQLRVILVQQAANGLPRWELPHTVAQASGSADWHAVENTFWISRRTESLELRVQLNGVAGTAEVRDIEVQVLQERDGFGTLRYALFMSWLVVWAWIVIPLISRPEYRWRSILAMLVGLAILGATLTPHTARQVLREKVGLDSGWVQSRERARAASEGAAPVPVRPPAAAAADDGPSYLWYAVQKSGHFMTFVLLTLAVFWARPRNRADVIFVCLACYGLIVEMLQLFAEERTPQLRDAAINVAGVLLGSLLAVALRSLLARFVAGPPPAQGIGSS